MKERGEKLMEILIITILTVFAFIGVASSILYLVRQSKNDFINHHIRIILYLPQYSSSKLEGIIRNIYYEGIPERLMSDGKIYLMVSHEDEEAIKIIEKLKEIYPIEVLPEQVSYCMIKNREKYIEI